MRLDQQRRELLAPPLVAADGQGAERIAMVALLAGDEMPALRLADLDEILARHLERGLHGLRAAADEIDVAGAGGPVGDEVLAQLLGDLRGEEAGVRVGELVELGVHGGQHVRVAVPEARHRRAARGIDILLAGGVPDVDALPARGHGIVVRDRAVQDAGHGVLVAATGDCLPPARILAKFRRQCTGFCGGPFSIADGSRSTGTQQTSRSTMAIGTPSSACTRDHPRP